MSTNNADLEADGACASFGTNRDLFTLPDSSHLGECPICFLPLPIEQKKSTLSKYSLMSCCSKYICNGCNIANQMREIAAGLKPRCAFCREPISKSQEESDKRMTMTKRVKKNDQVAMRFMGNKKRCHEGDYKGAVEYLTKAAELGEAEAHFNLSTLYREGRGVDKDMKKYTYHLEEAAIRGHPGARHNLGCLEADNGRCERAAKHFIIAANLGYEDSLQKIRELYADGHASKEDYADALRAYQVAVDATKSTEREAAEAFRICCSS